jgi:DNA-binding LacI/PurR family transcriptional regulator
MIDIARLAGVSQPAVSCVLRGDDSRIGAETAAKIRRIAKKLRYHPNHAAQQLAGKRSGIIAVLTCPWMTLKEARLIGWLIRAARQRKLTALAAELEPTPEALDAYIDQCVGWNIDGLIFLALENDFAWPSVAKAAARLPRVVSMMGDPGFPNGGSVVVDVGGGVRQAVTHLHKQGRRKIVQILEDLDGQMNRRRRQAFLDVHAELGRPVEEDQLCIATKGFRNEDIPKVVELSKTLVRERRPDAILAESDLTASGLLKGLARQGIRVPDDIAVIGWGDTTMLPSLNPAVTAPAFPVEGVTAAAIAMATEMIDDPEAPPRSVVVPMEFIVRESG